ncbi:AraC family transcriptional regulator [Paenochrobactrum gallinarii]|uniref:AraC family transcriptional regulator n=1 Tax=Paenochrobactrum gallinarii TaxID=643673 RepID=A0A841M7N3_9HYPH|nr:AraC family transcriptional regulator [Paenochrobactrum gallinarii]MBB6262261.1 AraC family transcriptional regulator [Paenochrobactrum gallinarii]
MLRDIPDEWGAKYQSKNYAVAYSFTGPNSINYTANHDSALILLSPQKDREIALNSDYFQRGSAKAGSVEIFPRFSEVKAKWLSPKQSLLVTLDRPRLSRLAGMEFDRDDFEFQPPPIGIVDDFIHLLGQAMRNEISIASSNFGEYSDGLVTILYTHILRNYSSLSENRRRPLNGGLPPIVWRRIREFIHDNISGSITLEDLASVAKLSPSHFSRAFRQTTGQSPYYYVTLTRLTVASEQIRSTQRSLSEIALSSGFSSQSHMTSMMRKIWGTTPARHRHLSD